MGTPEGHKEDQASDFRGSAGNENWPERMTVEL